jgi:MSHA biogenesis protein MshN
VSVVNKMLKDLESRQSTTHEINADYHAPQKKQSTLFVLILSILTIAAIIFALANKYPLFSETKSTGVAATVDAKASSSVPSPKKMAVITKPANIKQQAQSKIVATHPSIFVNPAINVLPDKEILPNEPEIVSDNSVSLPKISIQEKQLDTQFNNNIQNPVEQTSSFSMTGSSEENNSRSLKQRIAESLNDNNHDLAQSLLQELLETEPDNIKARKRLASLLFAQGNYMQSRQLLVKGIELQPFKGDLRLMLARLYMVQNEPSLAMNILAEFQPSRDNQTEYLAYRASLAQQFKQTTLAKTDYQALSNIESDNAKWWLGLAIAEDQLGETNRAIKSYKQAISLSQLDDSVNEFIQQRITVLVGVQ